MSAKQTMVDVYTFASTLNVLITASVGEDSYCPVMEKAVKMFSVNGWLNSICCGYIYVFFLQTTGVVSLV